jgi:hypothetical protein
MACVALFAEAPAGARAQCVPTPAGKWCPQGGSIDIPVYFHSSIPTSVLNANYVAITNAITEWNLESLGSGYHLVNAGACAGCDGEEQTDPPVRGILVKMAPTGPDGCPTTAGRTTLVMNDRAPGATISSIQKAILRLNSNQTWGTVHRATTARHEMGHALGMGHLAGCASSLLMTAGRPCEDPVRTLDGSATSGIACLYGTPEGDCASRRGVRVVTSPTDTRFFLENCPCTSGCPAGVAPDSGPVAMMTYELSISEGGGPYEVFATLTDADWVNGSYVHPFTHNYSQATILMRVLQDGVLVEQADTTDPVDITGTATAAPAVSLSKATRVFPNPVGAATALEFSLPADEAVQLSVYDVAGRRVLTLDLGVLPAGAHRVPLSREVLGERGARSGVFFFALRTERRTERGKLLLLE